MSSSAIAPALARDVHRQSVTGGMLLRHRRHGTQLLVLGEERRAVEAMDGEHSLEALEEVLAPARGTLGYQALVMLLYRLWDRGLLAEEEVVRKALFPHQTRRTLDRALAWRRVRRLVSFGLLHAGPARALRWLGALGRPLSSSIGLVAAGTCLGVGLALVAAGVIPWPEHLFRWGDSWVAGILLFYAGLSCTLSLRGLARAAVLEGTGTGLSRAGLRVTLGVAYLDVDDTAVYHLRRRHQVSFALVGLLVPGAAAGLLLVAAAARDPGGPLATVGAVALLAVFADLCPFLQTDGARLAEQVSAVDRQRFRVRTFISRRLLRGLFSGGGPESGRLTAVALLWFLWFFLALRVVVYGVLGDLLALQAAVISASDPALAVVGGLFLAALVVLMLVMLGTVLAISVALLIQLATPERVRAPTRREAAGETVSQEEVVARIRELPVGRGLPGEALEELASRAEVVEYPAGARIRQADGPDRRVLWVLSGHVELLRRHTEGGHSLAVALGPGEHFGDESLTDAAPRHDARARESVQLLALEGEAVADLSRAAEEGGRRAQETFEVARFLDGVSELAGLSPSARLELAFRVQEQEAAEGEAVIREGDPSDHMYLVRTGRCRVTRRGGDGGEQEVAEVGPGEAFGEVGLLYHRPRSATVTCLEPCRLVRVPRKALEQAMRQSFHVGLAMEELAEDRLAELRG